MTTRLCGAVYRRPEALYPEVVTMTCQYIEGHPSDRHSWFAVNEQDDFDAEAARQRADAQQGDGVVSEFLTRIEYGNYDSYLEAILSAAHNRKRALRGVRGFPDLGRKRRSA